MGMFIEEEQEQYVVMSVNTYIMKEILINRTAAFMAIALMER